MNDGMKLAMSLLSGIAVGKTVNTAMKSVVEDRSLIFNVGKAVAVGAITLTSFGWTFNSIDVIDRKVGGLLRNTVEKYKVMYEEAVREEESKDSDSATISEEENTDE